MYEAFLFLPLAINVQLHGTLIKQIQGGDEELLCGSSKLQGDAVKGERMRKLRVEKKNLSVDPQRYREMQ